MDKIELMKGGDIKKNVKNITQRKEESKIKLMEYILQKYFMKVSVVPIRISNQ